MEFEKLKHCPFCGGHNLDFISCDEDQCDHDCSGCDDKQYAILCSKLKGGCGGASGFKPTKEEAVEAWEKRANEKGEGHLHHLIDELEKEKHELWEENKRITTENERLKNQFNNLIGEIEAAQKNEYEFFAMTENLGDPQIYAMSSCKLLGVQSALNGVVRLIREMENEQK